MSGAAELGSALHVMTLTPFFPSEQNEVSRLLRIYRQAIP
jgi:hypothetical protein